LGLRIQKKKKIFTLRETKPLHNFTNLFYFSFHLAEELKSGVFFQVSQPKSDIHLSSLLYQLPEVISLITLDKCRLINEIAGSNPAEEMALRSCV
jgi:hypothetical protein